MLYLNKNQICPFANKCEYSHNCWGVRKNRNAYFVCDFVDSNGNIKSGMIKTKMRI